MFSQACLKRVQKCLNFAASLVAGARRTDHISQALASLGWHRLEDMVNWQDYLHVYRALREAASEK